MVYDAWHSDFVEIDHVCQLIFLADALADATYNECR
jgi:hypothetical protein